MATSSHADAPRPPLIMLRGAMHKEVSIETDNGDTYVGLLKSVDTWMNVGLRRVVRTAAGAASFWSAQEVFLRGASITNVTVPEATLDARPPTRGRGDGFRGGAGRGRGGAAAGGRGGRGAGGGRGRGGGGDKGRGRGAGNRGGRDRASGNKRNRDD